MSRPATPHDSAKAESFMTTLKTEEVNGKAYATIEAATHQIADFIETIDNRRRLHSALSRIIVTMPLRYCAIEASNFLASTAGTAPCPRSPGGRDWPGSSGPACTNCRSRIECPCNRYSGS